MSIDARAQLCILCEKEAVLFFRDEKSGAAYFHCFICDLRFLDPCARLRPEEERARYLHHENDVEDLRYQEFAAPLIRCVRKNIPKEGEGLDYGCGRASVIKHLLEKEGYRISLYDPYFETKANPSELFFDFIAAVEVAEHFFSPRSEFLRLRAMLKPGGTLFVMTLLFEDETDFSTWYYRRDPTHVAFYTEKTFRWIRSQFGYHIFQREGSRLISLRRE